MYIICKAILYLNKTLKNIFDIAALKSPRRLDILDYRSHSRFTLAWCLKWSCDLFARNATIWRLLQTSVNWCANYCRAGTYCLHPTHFCVYKTASRASHDRFHLVFSVDANFIFNNRHICFTPLVTHLRNVKFLSDSQLWYHQVLRMLQLLRLLRLLQFLQLLQLIQFLRLLRCSLQIELVCWHPNEIVKAE